MFSCSLLFSKDLWGHDAPLKCFPTDTSSHRQCGLRLLFNTESQNIAQPQVARSEAKNHLALDELILTRTIVTDITYVSCVNQQTALELRLCLSAWYRCDFNVSTYSILDIWSIILIEKLKLSIKAKANISIWSTNSHIISDFYPSKNKSIFKVCLYRHMSIYLIQFNMVCNSRFLPLSPLPP